VRTQLAVWLAAPPAPPVPLLLDVLPPVPLLLLAVVVALELAVPPPLPPVPVEELLLQAPVNAPVSNPAKPNQAAAWSTPAAPLRS
jgi:hypothetical protein